MIVAEYLVKRSNWLFVQTTSNKQVLTLKGKSHCANRADSFSYMYNSFLCAMGFELLQAG